MSAAEIIAELPRLTEAERRAVRSRLIELAVVDSEVEACDLAATTAAQLLDRMEEADARSSTR
jgi:hypothetical protein